MGQATDSFNKSARIGFSPTPSDPIHVWCQKHIQVDKTSPMPGRWRLDNSPWVKELMEAYADPSVNDISVMCAAQSAKTQTMINLACFSVACAPGPMMWVMAAQDEAKTFAKTRLMPTIEGCQPVAILLPKNRHEKMTLEINFASMPLIMNGANSKSKLQGKPIRYLLLDEVRNYPAGALEMVMKRTRAYSWNSKRLIISTPDMVNDAVHRAFLAGDQRHYYFLCPSCSTEQKLVMAQLKWDTNEITHPTEQEWDFDALNETIRYECIHCKFEIKDLPHERKNIARSGRWIPHNKTAPSNRVSFTWSALLPPWVKWRDLVQEFVTAKEAIKLGTIEPLKAFINESLGEPWEENIAEDQIEIRKGAYVTGDEWGEPHQKFLTIDVQRDHFWGVCRAWKINGHSRLIWEGKILTFEEINEIANQFGVTQKRVLIDSGFNAAQIYEQCVKYGWTALKGEDKEYFMHTVKDGKSIRRIYAPMIKGDPGLGKASQGRRFATLFLFASGTAKDILARIRKSEDILWEIPSNISPEYLYQLDSEIKKLRHNRITGQAIWEWVRIGKRPNHELDCEVMQIVAAVMAGILNKEN